MMHKGMSKRTIAQQFWSDSWKHKQECEGLEEELQQKETKLSKADNESVLTLLVLKCFQKYRPRGHFRVTGSVAKLEEGLSIVFIRYNQRNWNLYNTVLYKLATFLSWPRLSGIISLQQSFHLLKIINYYLVQYKPHLKYFK
jgi:hypothetical protein